MRKYWRLFVLMLALAMFSTLPAVAAAEEIGQGSGIEETEKIPETPVIKAARNSEGRFIISWNAALNASAYEIYIFEDEASTQRPDEVSPAAVVTETSYIHAEGIPGQKYYYRVRAVSPSEQEVSDFSNTVSGTAKLGTPKLSASYGTKTAATILKWKAIPGAVQYKIYAKDLSVEDSKKKLIATTDALKYTYSDGTVGKKYLYSVVAVGDVTAANSVAGTLEKMYYSVPPTVKVNYITSTQTFEVLVHGTRHHGARTQYREQGGEWINCVLSNQARDPSFFKPGKTYEFRSCVINDDREICSKWSTVISCLCRLSTPSSSITTKQEHPYLTWKKVTGATKYEIYRKIDGKYTRIATVKQSGSKMHYLDQDSSLKYGKKYYYQIVAVNGTKAVNSDPVTRSITYQKIQLNVKELYTRVSSSQVGPLQVQGTSKKVSWSSNNPTVASVKEGYILAKKTGTATISAQVDGMILKCKVKVLTGSAYVKKTAELWVKANITSGMSLKKKLIKASKTIIDGIIFDKTSTTAADALFYGYGNSKAAASALKAICEAMGYDASIHCMRNDSKSMYPSGVKRGSGYYNVKVKVDGNTYYIASEPQSDNCYLVKNGKCIHREKWVGDRGWKDVTG